MARRSSSRLFGRRYPPPPPPDRDIDEEQRNTSAFLPTVEELGQSLATSEARSTRVEGRREANLSSSNINGLPSPQDSRDGTSPAILLRSSTSSPTSKKSASKRKASSLASSDSTPRHKGKVFAREEQDLSSFPAVVLLGHAALDLTPNLDGRTPSPATRMRSLSASSGSDSGLEPIMQTRSPQASQPRRLTMPIGPGIVGGPLYTALPNIAINQQAIAGTNYAAGDYYISRTMLMHQQEDARITRRILYEQSNASGSYATEQASQATASDDLPHTVQDLTATEATLLPGDDLRDKSPISTQTRAVFLIAREPSTPVADTEGNTPFTRFLPLYPVDVSSVRKHFLEGTRISTRPTGTDASLPSEEQDQVRRHMKWPEGTLPVEIYELILSHLSRDDIKSMRLVNKECEKKVSGFLFHTAVVPFNTEVYDMVDDDARATAQAEKDGPSNQGCYGGHQGGGLIWQNAQADDSGKLYKGHGLRVFQGFGPHVKRFGMSFEVSEQQLVNAPVKAELDLKPSYFGGYGWPAEHYTRYEGLESLEQAADQTSRMRDAFAHLDSVQELALSLDSGLGWMSGQDQSMRAYIFQRPSPVFGTRDSRPSRQLEQAERFWQCLRTALGYMNLAEGREQVIRFSLLKQSASTVLTHQDALHADINNWPHLPFHVTPTRPQADFKQDCGVAFTVGSDPELDNGPADMKRRFLPRDLDKQQREWLLETEWAQRAFLDCYILAVIDNTDVFANVHSLHLSKVSSGLLGRLARKSFWDALPSLEEVTILAKADWRNIKRDVTGAAQTVSQKPSAALNHVYAVLTCGGLTGRKSISRLELGWQDGGEHAEGLYARNNNLLPAPLTRRDQSWAAVPTGMLVMPYVEHLTLTNCWISPSGLSHFLTLHAGLALEKVTLNSVSLTISPEIFTNPQDPILAATHINIDYAERPASPLPPQISQSSLLHNVYANQISRAARLQVLAAWQAHAAMTAQAATNAQLPPIMPPFPNPAQMAAALFNNNNADPLSEPVGPWFGTHREGSWPDLLNDISPGPTLKDYSPVTPNLQEPEPDEAPPPHKLQELEFISCGYAKLNMALGLAQRCLEPAGNGAGIANSEWLTRRASHLADSVQRTDDALVACIVQYIPPRQLQALQFAWGLHEGWEDERKAEGMVWDGWQRGGTGRFSGRIWKDMELFEGAGGAD